MAEFELTGDLAAAAKKKRDDLMQRVIASMPPLCAGLLDQGRMIGGEPVGYSCGNPAMQTVWSGGFGWQLCDRCAALFEEDSPRLTLTPYGMIVEKDGANGITRL